MTKIDRREALKAAGMAAGLFGLLRGKSRPVAAQAVPMKINPVDDPEPAMEVILPASRPRPPEGAWWVRNMEMKQEEHDVTGLGDTYVQRVPSMATIKLEIVSPDGLMSMKMECLQTSFTAMTPDAAARLP